MKSGAEALGACCRGGTRGSGATRLVDEVAGLDARGVVCGEADKGADKGPDGAVRR